MEYLIFECHDHQVVKLQRDKEKIGWPQMLVLSSSSPHFLPNVIIDVDLRQKATVIHSSTVNGVEYSIGKCVPTLSMLAGLSLIIEACANRVSTVFIVR